MVDLMLASDEERIRRAKEAEERRKTADIPLEADWKRIFASKLTDSDRRKLEEVKAAMEAGVIARSDADKYTKTGRPKAFSKAEALRLWARLQGEKKAEKLRELVENTPDNYLLVKTVGDLHFLRETIESADLIAVDCETFGEKSGDQFDPWVGKMAGFSVSTRERHFYVPLNHTEKTELTENQVFNELKNALESAKIVMHNAPFDAKFFYVHYGVDLIANLHADTRIMAVALDENRSHKLKDLITDWLKEPSDNFDQLFGSMHRFNEIPLDVALVYAAGDTEKTLKLYYWMMRWFDSREDLQRLKKLVFKIEMPVARQFIRSDLRGIGLDLKEAERLDAHFEAEEKRLEREIYEMVGEFCLTSPAQMSKKLFDELKLPNFNNGSTEKSALEQIINKHPVIPKILEYREINQLRKAFTKKLPHKIKADGKIHQEHNTWGAVTGRFTCKNPNTQQMPSKRPEVRKLFVTNDPDRIFISIDYSQIELRVLAHLSGDPVLIEAFETGKDIHSTTASQITGIPYEQIEERKDIDGTPEWLARKRAKTINFGIVYGMTPIGLAAQLDITRAEAENIIDDYFKAYPKIKRYMNQQAKTARRRGYVTDIFGRKRRLRNGFKKGYAKSAERQAGNAPIQASAGSIMKKAIVDLQPILPEMDVYILLQIHDELLFEAPRDITFEQVELIRKTMENAVKLRVPIQCDVEIYPERWMEKVDVREWFGLKG